MLDVAEILAVRVQRHRVVADDLDAVDVVCVEHVRVARMPEQHRPGRVDERAPPHADRRDDVEAELEVRLGRDRQRQPLRVRVRRRVRDERRRGASEPLHLERRLDVPAPRGERPDDGDDEREVARSLAVGAAPHLVDAAHGLGVDPEPGVEREAAAVDAAEA